MYDKLGYKLPDNANDLSEIGKVPGNKKVGVFERKAPYSFGWDWGPRLVTSGIWRPININFWNNFKINDLHLTQNIIGDDANIKAEIEVLSSLENQNLKARIYVDNKAHNVIPARARAQFNIRYNNLHTSSSLMKKINLICLSGNHHYRKDKGVG